MHQPAHQPADEFAMRCPRVQRSTAAFSLVEVTLAIGIIAFAFVALFGLLPTGLSTFRSAIDTSNEAWIMQSINSMVQTTDFAGIKDLGFETSGEIYYFDEEAKLTDTEQHKSSDEVVKGSRLYAVKLLIEELRRPDGTNSKVMAHGLRVIAVFAPVLNLKDFETVKNAASLQSLPKQSNVRVRTFFVARMDSEER